MNNEENSTLVGLMKVLEWSVSLAYLNLLWIIFTLAGGVIFGIGPATITVFSLVRKKFRIGNIVKPAAFFYHSFKENFRLGNQLFAVIGGSGAFLYIDFQLIQILPDYSFVSYVVIPAFIILVVLWLIVSVFVFGMITHYDLKFWDYFIQAFWLVLISPISCFIIVNTILINLFFINIVPAAFLFYFITPSVFVSEWLFLKKVNTLQNRKTKSD